ncbi:hypothetical protein AYR62_14510 [Secundilactobacillus paracollinoides]|uniref:Uncharacterized protein n=1 Tax=Secundilactobacillus paracollinoides TaxID=240427 RepID=A0A1B2IX76_9LACO|nr:hypothetical protein AYR61_05205 [Secundilactobacillus paracollinoides]ANZ65169.1 hypothetical protein AYR62_14510 [Secundilactobacillus paracollinoides]ANZ66641.1 hypothetical protein AYR63_05500 [Secundilactobacillus paracollinoides]
MALDSLFRNDVTLIVRVILHMMRKGDKKLVITWPDHKIAVAMFDYFAMCDNCAWLSVVKQAKR